MAAVVSVEVLIDGLDHLEGVAFDHASGVLYAGGEEGQIYAVDPTARTFVEVARTPGFVLGLAVDGRGRLVICDSVDAAVWVLADGKLRRLLDRVGDRSLVMPNYPAFGPDGTLYFSDSGRWKENNGAVISVTADGAARILDTTLNRFPNGCAVTPDGSELWMIQSLGPDVSRFDLARGGPPETVVTLPETVPDGIAFTEEGGVVISCYRPDRIYYLDPGGNLEVIAEDPEGTLLSAPTNICFLEDRRRMVSANLGRRHLTVLDLDRSGVVPHAPNAWAVDA